MRISGPATCRQSCDFVKDLEHGIIRDKDQHKTEINKIPLSPQLLVNFYGVEAWALLDTGSQITAISERFYEKLKLNKHIDEMPVSNVMVSTAIGSKSTTVKKQVLLEFECDGFKTSHICLVIPYLSSEVILGNDWNLKSGTVINYNKQMIQIRERVISSRAVLFERGPSDRICISRNDDITLIYVISVNGSNSNTENKIELNVRKINVLRDYDIDDDEYEILNGDEITESSRGNNLKINEINVNSSENKIISKSINAEEHNVSEELCSIASRLTVLSIRQRDHLLNLLIQNKNLFIEKPGGAIGFEYKLKIIKPNPVIYRSYSIPLQLRSRAEEKIKRMREAGIIERASGSICNPIRWIVKNNGDLRPCVDARLLNSVIEDDRESPPIISEMVQEFSNVNFYSKFDLTNSYWQITLHKDSRPYTAFLFGSAMYQFTRVPFGLKVAGSAFIRALNKTLENCSATLRKSLRYYIDDLLIGTDTFENHIIVLKELFSTLLKHNFTLNLSKCEFCKKQVLFLGFIISSSGITPNPEKLDIIRKFEEPRNKKHLQQILGVCNFYRRFYLKYHQLTEPFRDLLKKDTTWNWNQNHSLAFVTFKENFINVVCLKHILPGKIFRIQTDASDTGIAGVLYQIDDDNDHRIISIVSRFLTEAEVNYTTTEKELLAIIYTIYKLKYYLIGIEFIIVTDHKGLTFLNTTIYHNSRLIRWSLLLQQFSFKIEYCKGSENIVADFFSRNPDGKFIEQKENKIIMAGLQSYFPLNKINNESTSLVIMLLNKDDESLKKIIKNIRTQQNRDACLRKIIESINNNGNIENYVIYEDILFHRERENLNWRLVIPGKLSLQLIKFTHTQLGHPGVYKTQEYLKRFYYWKSMGKQIKQYVVACDLCQRVKHLSIAMEGEYDLVRASSPNELVTVDFYGPLPRGRGGVQYLFVVLDAFSKLVRMFPLKNATTYMSLRCMIEKYIPECGKPKRILSDNGTQFTSPKWRTALEEQGIDVVFSSIRHPQSNPTERVMREIGRMFRTFCNEKHTSWANHVKEIEKLLNITTHFSTQCTPQELHFGTPIGSEIYKLVTYPENFNINRDYLITLARENIIKNFDRRKKSQRVSKVELVVGDRVLLRVRHLSNALDRTTKKFFHLYEGPYVLSRKIGNNAFVLTEVSDGREIGTYNRTNLRKYQNLEHQDCDSE